MQDTVRSYGPVLFGRYADKAPTFAGAGRMRWIRFIILGGIFLLVALPAVRGQSPALSNLRDTLLLLSEEWIRLDSLSLVPSSLELRDARSGAVLDPDYWEQDGSRIRWSGALSDTLGPVRIRYRTFPFALDQPAYRLDTTRLRRSLESPLQAYTYAPSEPSAAPLLDFRGLDYNGSFARGLSFGNNQDLVLNSRFNLQLAGTLGEDVELLAAITDENIPLQPQGNTQQLQELDRVFIQLKRKNTRLIAGDYELGRPRGYFLNYFKKLQGATVRHRHELGKLGQVSGSASVAISRGNFARNQLETQEGNQGPYKLRGAQGERFIIVLAGTERVYLDGQVLQRGVEADYIIDYNRGELLFTNQVLITKDTRLIVEFEYSDQGYVRSLLAADATWQGKKHQLYLNVISQQDSKNATGLLELSDADKETLRAAGDELSQAVVSTVDTLEEFSPQRASYKRVDTTGCAGEPVQALVFTTDPDEARYTARFSFVGPGNGNYVLDPAQVANERVYRWVPPGPDCTPAGDYEPVVQLVPPGQQQMATLGGVFQPKADAELQAELALSRQDLNRFSPLDSDDDLGMAAFFAGRKSWSLGTDSSGWTLLSEGRYEYVHRQFALFNPYRPQEFLRDWSLTDINNRGSVAAATEHLFQGSATLRHNDGFSLRYGLGGFFRDSLYQGIRQDFALLVDRNNWEVEAVGSLLNARQPTRNSRFFRPRILLARTFPELGGWRLGAQAMREKNSRQVVPPDTLAANSFYYDRYQAFLESPAGKPYQFSASYTRRTDFAPVESGFQASTVAQDAKLQGQWQVKRLLRLSGNFSYRKLAIADPRLTNQQAAETFLGRADAGLTLFKGALRSNTTYELGTGQEPKLEFTFVKVARGEGQYIWLDSLYNNDGVIQPNEMEIAPFPDQADYVRVTTVTDEFVPADYVNLNQSLQLNPKAVFFDRSGFLKALSLFSAQSSLVINRRTRPGEGVSRFNPVQLDVADTSLVAVSSNMRNVLFFNRAHPVFGGELGRNDQRSKTVQTTGFESRRLTEQFVKGRWNLDQEWSTSLAFTFGQRQSDSEQFDERRYLLQFYRLEPECTFQPTRSFRTRLRYRFERQNNRLGETDERSNSHDLTLEFTLNSGGKSSIRADFSWVQVQFAGRPNSPVGFAMLSGLQPGRNLLWSFNLDRQLARNLLLSLNYEGRQTGLAGVVHVGRAQIAATF